MSNAVNTFSFPSAASAKLAMIERDNSEGSDLTIIVPCFNTGQLIESTCYALVNTNHALKLEVILVNDGGTDGSVETAATILSTNGVKTTVINIPNSGLSAARNVGLHFAKTEHVAFLDSDDAFNPIAYKALVDFAVKDNLDQVFARASWFEERDLWSGDFYDAWVWDQILGGLSKKVFKAIDEPVSFMIEPKICARVWNTAFIRNMPEFPEGRIFEDIGVHLQTLARSERIGILDIQGLHYRANRAGALTQDKSRKRFDAISNISDAIKSEALRTLPAECGAYICMSMQRMLGWCRGNIHLQVQGEFDQKVAELSKEIPASWIKQLYKTDHKAANRFVRNATRPFSMRSLSSKFFVKTFLKENTKKKKRRATIPQPPVYGFPTDGTKSDRIARYRFDHARKYGPILDTLYPNAQVVFEGSAEINLLTRLARTYSSVTIHCSGLYDDEAKRIATQYPNIRQYETREELIAALRASKATVVLYDAADLDDTVINGILSEIDVDHVFGKLNVLNGLDIPSALAKLRSIVRIGYHVLSSDGSLYSYKGQRETPAVSVVVPVYNVLPYLDKCVESLSNQTLKSREIILVDDGATDGSAERCDEWAAKDPTIRVIHKVNGGCASARMAGLEQAQGQYITWIDGDDWTNPNMLQRLYDTALLTGDDVVEGSWCFAYPSGTTVDMTGVEKQQSYRSWGGILRRRHEPAITGQPTIWRRLYRRRFIDNNKIGFDARLRRFDDMPFQFETLIRTADVAFIDECLLYYRQNREGQDIGVSDDRLYVHFPIMKSMRSQALSSGSKDAYKMFLKIQWNTHQWAIGKIEQKLKNDYLNFAARDIFGSEQLGSAKSTLFRLIRMFPTAKAEIIRMYLRYHQKAKNVTIPTVDQIR